VVLADDRDDVARLALLYQEANMPKTPGQAFLDAFTLYIDFRLTEQGPPQDPKLPALVEFVDLFEKFISIRPGAQSHKEACDDLVAKMAKMKDTRGTGGIPPDNQQPGG
jgi:hypothetical protein